MLLLLASLSPVLALDSSSSALAGATTTVSIGTSPNYWSMIPSYPASYSVNVGDKLSFAYSVAHNVYAMPSAEAYASCDFSGATLLAGSTYGGGASSGNINLYEVVASGQSGHSFVLYIACSSHCASGQKITIAVNAAASASTSPPPPPTPPPQGPPAMMCPDKKSSLCVNRGKLRKYCPDNVALNCKASFSEKTKKKKCKKFQKKCKGTCDICPTPLPPVSPSPPPSPPGPPPPPPPVAQGGSFQDTGDRR